MFVKILEMRWQRSNFPHGQKLKNAMLRSGYIKTDAQIILNLESK